MKIHNLLQLSDTQEMTRCFFRAGVPGGILRIRRLTLGLFMAACMAVRASGAQDDEVQPDLNALRAKADSGSVTAQMQLADRFIASDDYTNAVVWYRKAAQQGDLAAQLSLASLLIAGRGTEKNPQEAAKWLRAAADRIENKPPPAAAPAATVVVTNLPLKGPTNAIIITRTNLPAVTNAALNATTPRPIVAVTNPPVVTRVPRAGVAVPEPALQEVSPVLKPPQEPR
ncbi:MAG: uncharacterized protein QOF48_2028 [Verrucomicrobiota bacterium]